MKVAFLPPKGQNQATNKTSATDL